MEFNWLKLIYDVVKFCFIACLIINLWNEQWLPACAYGIATMVFMLENNLDREE